MSQFCGLLRRALVGHPPDSAADEVIRARAFQALSRSNDSAPSVIEDPGVWLATLSASPWRQGITWQRPAGWGAVAGDPHHGEGDDNSGHEMGCMAVVDDLLHGQTSALAATRGMFAAVAWNPSSGKLGLATDKLANRCLYYKVEADRFIFASSIRLLRCLVAEREVVDDQGFAEFLFFSQPLGRRTLFDGVQLLAPGECLQVDAAGSLQRAVYHDLLSTRRSGVARQEAEASLHRTFASAVRRRAAPGPQEAFLSGGMDSRAVVAALVDQGHAVRTFCTAYPDSIDAVVSKLVAAKLNTSHTLRHRTPAERVKVSLDPFAMYARQHFPAACADAGRQIWSGDGGSVMLGHVYLSESRMEAAQQAPSADLMRRLFPALQGRPTRQIGRARMAELADRALAGVLAEFKRYAESTEPDRRLFMFYALNDQSRHLYHHFESIDLSRIELVAPFFDADLVTSIMSMPTSWFIGHRLYNTWIRGFKCGAGDIYWQPYPGHETCPHPNPATTPDQWSGDWYSGPEVRRAHLEVARSLLTRRDPLALNHVSPWVLRLALTFGAIGSNRFAHEISYARNVFDALNELN